MTARALAIGVLLAAGCRDDIATIDGAFYAWDDRPIQCAVDLDASSGNTLASVNDGLDRARDRGEVLELLVHSPGDSLGWQPFEAVLAAVRDHGLPFLTYRDLAPGATPQAGVALEYDDWGLVDWMASRELLHTYNAHVTIFVARYSLLSDDARAMLRVLAADGNEIQAHSVLHLRGPDYVEQHGLEAYLTQEVLPSIEVLRADGYPVDAYAYPFGVRTSETDRAILDRGGVRVLRSLSNSSQLRETACPN